MPTYLLENSCFLLSASLEASKPRSSAATASSTALPLPSSPSSFCPVVPKAFLSPSLLASSLCRAKFFELISFSTLRVEAGFLRSLEWRRSRIAVLDRRDFSFSF